MRHLRAALGNPAIRRVVIAYATFNFAEWAVWVAVLVYAFQRGGAAESGIVAFVMLVPAAIVAPVVSSLAGRFPRERMLVAAYVVQAIVISALSVALFAEAAAPIVYALASMKSMSISLTRPAHGSILPSLARTPKELTAANVASGTVQNISIMVAPFAAGVILANAGAGAVCLVCAAGLVLGATLVAGVRVVTDDVTSDIPVEAPPDSPGAVLLEGLRYITRSRGPRTVVALIAAAAVIEGALDVLVMVVAITLVGGGATEVGLLSSAAGLGGVLGAAAAVTLVGRARLAGPFAFGLLVWGVPTAILGIAPGFAAALILFTIAGSGRGSLDVAGRTLLQRVTPDAELTGVFGALEGGYMGMIAVGSIAVPLLIALLGPHAALIAIGLWMPLVVAASWRTLRSVDAAAVVHVRELELLRGDPLFEPLAPPTIERLSANLVPVTAATGSWIIREGEIGDRFYLVDSGEVDVTIDGRPIRRQGPGSSFGEIALLRDVPRTASVQAATDARFFALERDVFLAAVAGHARSSTVAEAVVAERLGSS